LAQTFLTRCQDLPKISVAVFHPCSEEALNGAIESAQLALIEPILIAPEQKLLPIAKQCNVDLSKFTFINVPHSHAAAEMAVKYAKEGKVDALMKGSLHTDELMTEVIKKEAGLRTERCIDRV
jgi:phosphotransacetylase